MDQEFNQLDLVQVQIPPSDDLAVEPVELADIQREQNSLQEEDVAHDSAVVSRRRIEVAVWVFRMLAAI
jgi:hypothetical protein